MLSAAARFFRFLFGIGSNSVEPDGFGQSIAQDIRFALNFRRCRRTVIVWRQPTADDDRAVETDPIVGRFGDMTIGVADVAGRRWIVRERDWHGWPDPPRFVFFAMDQGEVWAVADFDRWPPSWQWPSEWTRAGIHR